MMKYKIINLIDDKYDKSIVLYGKYGDYKYVSKLYWQLMRNLNITIKDGAIFRIDRATINFKSYARDELEDEVKCELDKYFEDLEKEATDESNNSYRED